MKEMITSIKNRISLKEKFPEDDQNQEMTSPSPRNKNTKGGLAVLLFFMLLVFACIACYFYAIYLLFAHWNSLDTIYKIVCLLLLLPMSPIGPIGWIVVIALIMAKKQKIPITTAFSFSDYKF